jgi:hypothetical protein
MLLAAAVAAAVVAAGCGAVVAAGAGAAPSDIPPTPWKMEPWYDAVNSELWLVSNGAPAGVAKCNWTGAAYALNSNTNDFKLWGCARPSFVWKKTCTEAAQNVSFTKRIFVPGRPGVFEASLYSIPGHPLERMALEVNNVPVLTARHDIHRANLKGRSAAFKFGWNVLELSAGKGKGACRADVATVGVALELHLQFHADLVAKSPQPANSNTAILFDQVTITNKGPSSTNFGTVSFSVGTSHLKEVVGQWIVISKSALGPPLDDDCKYYNTSTNCPMPGLDPGESFTFWAHYIYDAPLPPTKFYEEFLTSWGASADTLDPVPATGGGRRYRGVCRQDAPPPCKKP